MPQRTLREAITQVTRNMSLTNGVAMTPYSEETVASYLIAAHEMIVEEAEWAEMMIRRQRTLDGTTGKITVLITDTDDWKQIKRIYHSASMTPLGVVSSYINPLIVSAPFGYRGLAPEEDHVGPGKYLVQFMPETLNGDVLFDIQRVIDFTQEPENIVLPIDWWLHVYHASWAYANDDGTNPAQIMKYQQLYSQRMKQVMAKENSRPSYLNPNQTYPGDWWVDDAPYS